ncbi:MAG: hypothetical protein V1874_12880 [Spirochaetota bacterium]
MKKNIFSIIFIAYIFLGCGQLKGEFAYKNTFEDKYRKADRPLELEKNEKIKWVYIFVNVREETKIGVVLLKKEIVWVDIDSRTEKISPSNKIIYGDIVNLPDGEYKITLTHSDKIIDELGFSVFTEQEEEQ